MTNPISAPETTPAPQQTPPVTAPAPAPVPTPPPGQPAAPVVPGPAGIQTGPPPAPTPAPVYQQPPVPQQPPAPAPQQTGAKPTIDGEEFDFPEATALAAMTPQQQAEYWRHKARKHENTVKSQQDYADIKAKAEQYEQLVQASQTEHEKQVAEARRQGHAEALASAGGQLVEQWIRAAASGRLPEASVNALLEGVDRSRFLAPGGTGVDTDKVYSFVNSLIPAVPQQTAVPTTPIPTSVPATPTAQPQVPAPTGAPDFGQGQGPSTRPTGLAAGREIARQRFGNRTPN